MYANKEVALDVLDDNCKNWSSLSDLNEGVISFRFKIHDNMNFSYILTAQQSSRSNSESANANTMDLMHKLFKFHHLEADTPTHTHMHLNIIYRDSQSNKYLFIGMDEK